MPKFSCKNSFLGKWISSTVGRVILEMELLALNNLSIELFGHYLLQIDGPKDVNFARFSHVQKTIYLNSNLHSLLGSHCDYRVCSDFTDLPFQPFSIDAVLAFHILQGHKNPGQILNEISELLVGDGYLIIFEFNPYSLLGLQHFFMQDICKLNQNKMCSSYQIRKLLHELGFSIKDSQTFFFRPVCKKEKTLQKLLFLEGLGAMFCSDLGGVSMIVAQKKVFEMTPIKEGRRTHVQDAVPVVAHALNLNDSRDLP